MLNQQIIVQQQQSLSKFINKVDNLAKSAEKFDTGNKAQSEILQTRNGSFTICQIKKMFCRISKLSSRNNTESKSDGDHEDMTSRSICEMIWKKKDIYTRDFK